jgi:hypothetical protein
MLLALAVPPLATRAAELSAGENEKIDQALRAKDPKARDPLPLSRFRLPSVVGRVRWGLTS